MHKNAFLDNYGGKRFYFSFSVNHNIIERERKVRGRQMQN